MNILKNRSISFLRLAPLFFVLLIALISTYSDVLTGSHNFLSNDKVSAMNVKEAINQSDDYPYWFPWMMGGVPSVHSAQNISDYYPPNYIMKLLNLIGVPWFFNYIFAKEQY